MTDDRFAECATNEHETCPETLYFGYLSICECVCHLDPTIR